MKRPEKKEETMNPNVPRKYTIRQFDKTVGYNQACDDWEAYLKEKKRIWQHISEEE